MHLSVWEDGMRALLDGLPQWQGMGLDEAIWAGGNEHINSVIQQRHQAQSLADVQQALQHSHQRLLDKINSLEDADLLRPYHSYQPQVAEDRPIIDWIVGNSFMHYHEHQPWIAAIAEQP